MDTYEKKYKEALERAREIKGKILQSHLSTESCKAVSEYIDTIIPELRESENERIKNLIYCIVRDRGDVGKLLEANGCPVEKALSWLEKQKELPFVKDVILGYPGLYFYDGERMHFRGSPAMEEKQKEPHYTKRNALFDKCVENCDPEIMKRVSDEIDAQLEKDQKPTIWTEEDEKNLCELLAYGETRLGLRRWIAGLPEKIKGLQQKPAEWSEEDSRMLESALWHIKNSCGNGGKTSGEYEVYNWAKNLPNRFNPQPKPEWSEKDEKMIERLITRLNWITYNTRTDGTSLNITFFDEIAWLKSLRPQPHGEIYQAVKHDLAIKFMNYLDENRPEGKMSLSNVECEDIDKAFKENDWTKIMRYAEKYGK